MKKGLILALVLGSLAACSGEPSPTPDLVATQIAVEDAAHATMTARVPTATNTPEPTSTATATPTPTWWSTPTPPPAIEAEEYAVYSALIQQNPVHYNMGSPIVIQEHTTEGADTLDSALEYHDLPADLVASYRSRNAASYTLGPDLELEQDYALLLRGEYDELFPRRGANWAEFYTRYPEARGFVVFSRVGFDAAGDTALVEMGVRCGDLCAAGGLYLLVKEGGNWVVQGALLEWMA